MAGVGPGRPPPPVRHAADDRADRERRPHPSRRSRRGVQALLGPERKADREASQAGAGHDHEHDGRAELGVTGHGADSGQDGGERSFVCPRPGLRLGHARCGDAGDERRRGLERDREGRPDEGHCHPRQRRPGDECGVERDAVGRVGLVPQPARDEHGDERPEPDGRHRERDAQAGQKEKLESDRRPASSPSAMTAARIAARAMTVTTMTLRRLDARSSHAPTNGPDAMPGRSCAAAPAPATAGLPVRSSR